MKRAWRSAGAHRGRSAERSLAIAACRKDYPNRSITVIVPFPAGGPSDVVARIVTDQMSKTLGQSMVIAECRRRGRRDQQRPGRGRTAGRLYAARRQHGLSMWRRRC